MSKLIDRPIPRPMLGRERQPLLFTWRGQQYRVREVLDTWRDIGAWWEGEAEREYWRVETEDGGVWELWRNASGQWGLYRVYD